MRKVFWLSFCDSDRPKGHQFLGACLIEVSDAEASHISAEMRLRYPSAQAGAEWIAAALRNAHALGCNPGGEVATIEVEPDHPNLEKYRMGVLMDRATIERIDSELA